MLMKCKICNKPHNKKAFCSKQCYWESLKGLKGELAPNYREKVGYHQVHKWLIAHYGNENKCEFGNCTMKSKTYDWALKKRKSYLRKRENFLRLCRSCHRRYDLTPEKKIQAIKNLIKHNPYKNKDSYDKYRKLVGRV